MNKDNNRVVRVILSVLLGLFAFAALAALIALITARPAGIGSMIEQADISELLGAVDISDELLGEINESSPFDMDLSAESIRDFLVDSNVADEAGKLAGRLTGAIASGDFEYYITSDEIISMVESVSPHLYDAFGYEFTDEDREILTTVLEDIIDLEDYNVGYILDEAGVDIALPLALLSPYLLAAAAVLCALFFFDIFLLHRRKILYAFLVSGTVLVAAGAAYAAAGFFIDPLLNVLGIGIPGLAGALSGVAGIAQTCGLITLCAGVLSFITFIVLLTMKRQEPGAGAAANAAGDAADGGTGKDTGKNTGRCRKIWLCTGAAVNVAALAACAVLVFVCLPEIPDAGAYRRAASAPGLAEVSIQIQEYMASLIPEPEPVAAKKTELYEWTQPGDVIGFGGYDWLVLDVQPDKVLIITEKVIGDAAYHSELVEITWADCELRGYLNGEFYDSFSAYHQSWILETDVVNIDNPVSGTPGGEDTKDYIFLLGYTELAEYFNDNKKTDGDDEEVLFYIDKAAAKTFHIDDSRNTYYDFIDLGVRWWLRTPGVSPRLVTLINDDGGYLRSGGLAGDINGIRPAMWIRPPEN